MEKRKQTIAIILLLLPLLVFMTTGEEHQSSGLKQFLGKVLNFVILFGGLAFILSKPLRKFLEKRAEEIENSLKEAENSRIEAEKKLEAAKAKLDSMGVKLEKMKEEAEKEGQEEKERIIRDAEKEAERIKELSRQEIELLLESGIRELREYAAEKAVNLARERIKKRLTPENHSLFIDKCIERLALLDENSYFGKKIRPGIG